MPLRVADSEQLKILRELLDAYVSMKLATGYEAPKEINVIYIAKILNDVRGES